MFGRQPIASATSPSVDSSGNVVDTHLQAVTTAQALLNGITLSSNTELLVVHINENNCHMMQTKDGTTTAATLANAPLIPTGTILEMTTNQATHTSVISATGTCNIFIEERSI